MIDVPNNSSRVKDNASAALPITWNQFLQGVGTFNYPSTINSYEVDTVAIDCTTTTVTVSARCQFTVSTTGIRYVVFGY